MKTIDDITQAFGDYRAEWQPEDFERRFVAPPFFESLLHYRPVFLVGGRGTGKTVALRSMTFDFAEKLRRHGLPSTNDLGAYIRFNKNQVRVFEFIQDTVMRGKAFAHYVNLLIAHEVCALFEKWLPDTTDNLAPEFDQQLELTSISLGLRECHSINQLSNEITKELNSLVLAINNPERLQSLTFSTPEAPMRQLVGIINTSSEHSAIPGNPTLHICLDEYENLDDWQQEIVNTYIKHAERPLTYKVGVRMNGLRTRRTLDANDPLTTPEDYAIIDATDRGFKEFATEVVRKRLITMQGDQYIVPTEPSAIFPQLEYEEEANKLGIDRHAKRVRSEIDSSDDQTLANWIRERTTGEIGLVAYLSKKLKKSTVELVKNSIDDPSKWENWKNNYRFAALFWYASGLQGKSIKKYISGFDTILDISGGNIRYCLEMIYESMVLWETSGGGGGTLRIPAEDQTMAARTVAERRLTQVEEQSSEGKKIKRLVLAIGRIFGLMALDPRRAPEKNSFILSGTVQNRSEVQELLRVGVGHQAFVVVRRTKPTDKAETKDDEYRLHPIFCPFFEYSWRRKRRVTFDARLLLDVAQGADPRAAIRELSKAEEKNKPHGNLPNQLHIYDAFFEGRRDD